MTTTAVGAPEGRSMADDLGVQNRGSDDDVPVGPTTRRPTGSGRRRTEPTVRRACRQRWASGSQARTSWIRASQ